MAALSKSPDVLVFDYGNTLIEFGPTQAQFCDRALMDALTEEFGTCDGEAVAHVRHRHRMAPYAGNPPSYHENQLREITQELVKEVFGVEPSEALLERLLEVRYVSFVDSIIKPDYLDSLLEELGSRYTLALISNYPCGRALRDSIKKLNLMDYFRTVVISDDVGRVKPHPIPFETMLKELDASPEESLYVGDNWLADIQGAKRLGMQAIWTQQFISIETFLPSAGDVEPDATIQHLTELTSIL
ncbi:MAG: HAD family hydrolase [Myxococcota bacterium]|nr:HAD family hydrolase [Myxococcota bacterium]